jgi:serine/threonine protein kinase
MFELGPFQVEERVGVGAMGQVWRGVHERSGTPVAVKFVLPQQMEREAAAASVRREARAIAGLQHPHVVYVYDQGELTETHARALTDEVRALDDCDAPAIPTGSPYIVMELLSGGSLKERHAQTSWDRVRADLERVLEALAHCHAHGVLHRDLKPTNVLFGAASDPRPGLKLVDFGIAWSRGEDGEHVSFGTPEYCAPEQQGSEGAAQGPWTDLFAVGAIAWLLVTGELPFGKRMGPALYVAKATTELPDMTPRFEVPDELEAWLRSCMAGPPGDRFQSAPDALYHLKRVAGAALDSGAIREWTIATNTTKAMTSPSALPARTVEGCPEPAPLRREPLEVPLPPPALRDAGLEMWTFRPPPMTGRLAQRVRLWQRLEHVATDGRPRGLLLAGPPGSGRTRVGAWLLTAAQENGGLFAFATRGEAAQPGQASHLLLQRILRVEASADPREQVDQAHWSLEHHGADFPDVVEAVDAWLGAPDVATHRLQAAVAVLRGLARGRPVLLLLDDADADPELAELVNRLLAADPLPILAVLTAEGAVDAAVEEVPRLDPMRRRTLAQLLSNLLPLVPASQQDVVAAAAGRPGRAMEVLKTAFRNDQFRHTPRGIVLDLETEEAAALPTLPRPTREYLERAALLGVFPDHGIVTSSFRNRRAASRALEDAEERRLVAVRDSVVSFSPGVRRAIVDAMDLGTRTRHHRALGRVLAPESADGALHRIQGGDPDGGFAQLVQAIEIMDPGTGMMHRLSCCERGLELWDALGREPSPGPWEDLVIHRLEALGSVEAPELADIVRTDLERASAHGVDDATARLLVARARLEPHTASKDLHHALVLSERHRVRTEVFHALAQHAERSGDLPLCRYWLSCATHHVDSDDRAAASDAYVALGTLMAMDGLWQDAHGALNEAVKRAVVPGVLDIFAANTAMVVGDRLAARSGLVRGVHWTTLRRDRRLLPGALIRLALVDLLEGQLADAEARIVEADRILAENRRQYRPDPSFGADVRLLLALEREQWSAAVGHLGNLGPMRWPRPTRVAVFRRIRALVDAERVPDDLREALEIAERNLYALREQWA